MTKAAEKKYSLGQRELDATNSEWGLDGWPTYSKTLVVVYEVCENYTTVIAKEGNSVTLP